MKKYNYPIPYLTFYLISCCFVVSPSLESFRCLSDQSSALLQLKEEFEVSKPYSSDTSHLKKVVMDAWNVSTDCCFWSGVRCNMSTGRVVSLNLSNSGLQGRLRDNSSLFSLDQLQQLNLAFNNFGFSQIPSRIPSEYFGNWSAMNAEPVQELHYRDTMNSYYQYSLSLKVLSIVKTIDLSNNDFHGEIPDSIGEIPSLVILNLSANGFTRSIPISLGCLSKLEAMDLSRNKLSGRIPAQLANLKFLAYLNLSHNQLTGQIPQCKPFNTFESSCYEGNLGLCGFPLSKNCDKLGTQTSENSRGSESVEELDWKAILMGYGFGLLIGLITGHIIISNTLQCFVQTLAGHIRSCLYMII